MWHEARLATLRYEKPLKSRRKCLEKEQMKAGKFCAEVMEKHKEREFIRQLEMYHHEQYYHEQNIAKGSLFEGK